MNLIEELREDEFKSIHANFKLKEGDILFSTIVAKYRKTAILKILRGLHFKGFHFFKVKN